MSAIPERITRRIERHDKDCSCCDGCWVWRGTHSPDGYASVWWKGRMRSAHRVIFEIANNVTLTTEQHAHHCCRNRWCINPNHVEALRLLEHSHLHSPLKTHCKRGHPLSGDNVRVGRKSNGRIQRTCLACDRLRPRRSRKAAGVS